MCILGWLPERQPVRVGVKKYTGTHGQSVNRSGSQDVPRAAGKRPVAEVAHADPVWIRSVKETKT